MTLVTQEKMASDMSDKFIRAGINGDGMCSDANRQVALVLR